MVLIFFLNRFRNLVWWVGCSFWRSFGVEMFWRFSLVFCFFVFFVVWICSLFVFLRKLIFVFLSCIVVIFFW